MKVNRVDLYCSTFRNLDIAGAGRILHPKGCLKDSIRYTPTKGYSRHLTSGALLDKFTPDTRVNLIRVVSFQGGPPGNHGWYWGSFLTYILDRILWNLYLKEIDNGKYLEKIGHVSG